MRFVFSLLVLWLLVVPSYAQGLPQCFSKDQVVDARIAPPLKFSKLDAAASDPLRALLNVLYGKQGLEEDPPGTSYIVAWRTDFPVAKVFIFDGQNCYTGFYTLYPRDDALSAIGETM